MKNKNTQTSFEGDELKKSATALREEKTLAFWKEKNIFQKSLDKEAPMGEYVFYDGPPTANGRPGIHHLEARAFKDAIPRYKTMRGYYVRRKAGWDTHGLPVELEVEKQLGFTSKKEIEAYGIAPFNKKCKESVWKYVDEWQAFTERTGYWIDLENPYITYTSEYVESLWWVMKQIGDQDLVYKDYRVTPWCPRCGTALSSHELAQGYMDVKDLSITAKFELVDEPGTFVLAWTTTPWTLPGNVGLAVGGEIDYIKVKVGNEYYFLAETRKEILGTDYEIVETLKGKELVGKSYTPLFPYLKTLAEEQKTPGTENAYKIYSADFVTTTDGTGIVHTAVMYGADDFDLGTKVGLPKFHLVNTEGKFIFGTDFLEGRFVKEETDGKPTLAIDIIKYLQEHNFFFAKEKYEHSYPHCWRCKTALIYYARDSWYINMQKIKQQLIDENQTINWQPEYLKDGRFGEWLKELRDWAISRERYWGTPLPIWESADGEKIFIGSFDELKQQVKRSGNRYFMMRHGEAEKNLTGHITTDISDKNPLTEKGKQEVRDTIENLRKENIDMIIVSPFQRTQETAEIIATELGLADEQVLTDHRIGEIQMGEWENKTWEEFYKEHDIEWHYANAPENGESRIDLIRRVGEFLYDLENSYKGKNILIVTHGGGLGALNVISEAMSIPDAIQIYSKERKGGYQTGQYQELLFTPLPHNENYELDPHKPFIDEVVLEREGKEFHRVKEVIDVWFDSGAMPFAQDHSPFTTKIENQKYPADFIAEGVDQTRGWFYTLHAIGNLLGRGKAYKNVISFGLINDAQGQKMSKSKGNTVNPWVAMGTFGADTLRFWMYSVSGPGDTKSFDEKTILETQRKVFGLLENVIAFYELYKDDSAKVGEETVSNNVLDRWILAELNTLIETCTKGMDTYQLLEPTRAIRDFIADLSRWYIRRSRDRFKEEESDDKKSALRTTEKVLIELSKLMAPFAPFFAEDMYQRAGGEKESVHLENWPTSDVGQKTENILENMEHTRAVVSLGLEARDIAGIKVRQPLQSLTITTELPEEFLELIKDEVNVKQIFVGTELALDATITDELAGEGNARELIRHIQSMRKNEKLHPDDTVKLVIATDETGQELVNNFGSEIKKTAGISEIIFEHHVGEKVIINDMEFSITIQK